MTFTRGLFLGTAAAAMLMVAPGPARAAGIPVIDASSIAQLLTTYREMLEQSGLMTDQIENQFEQIEQGVERFEQLGQQIGQLQEQIDAMTGTRELSGILDGLSGLSDLLPTDTGGGGTTAASIRLDDLLIADQVRSGIDLFGDVADPTSLRAVAYTDARNKTYVEAASAQILIEGMPEIEAGYSTLIGAIDATEDVKGSIDLLARIAAENGRSIARLTHLMAISAQARSAEDRSRYVEEESTGAFTDDSWDAMGEAMVGELE